MWKTASFQEKEYYQKLAEEFKREHQEKYPDYKYSPVKQKRKCKKSECGINKKHQRCPEYPVSGDPNLTCFTPTADGAHLNSGNRPSFLDVTLGEMPLNLALDTQELDITTDLDSPVFSEISLPNEATWPYHFPPYYEQSACSFDQFNLGLYVPEARFSQEFYDPLLIPHQYFQN
ncbi:hypothetical protein K7432_012880 [Basidiobolus ranarum]|uniref:HMG box domain-containing protein n=1 Tax=Basidiobolus ranarum TaxID=34480 RepID=A0ABR2WK38_9FUNG